MKQHFSKHKFGYSFAIAVMWVLVFFFIEQHINYEAIQAKRDSQLTEQFRDVLPEHYEIVSRDRISGASGDFVIQYHLESTDPRWGDRLCTLYDASSRNAGVEFSCLWVEPNN